ncbi:ABC transporter permease [Corynebacterium bovis]|uniref:ABC transporter permease subunit n=1 Tax=Corynebacterium bovis TaxID=36808 RepID=UPI00313A04D5
MNTTPAQNQTPTQNQNPTPAQTPAAPRGGRAPQRSASSPEGGGVGALTGLGRALRSETLKILTVRSTIVYLILAAGAMFGPMVLGSLLSGGDIESFTLNDLLIGTGIAQVIVVAFGAAGAAGETRSGMVAQAFLTEKSRSLWLIARIIVSAVAAAVMYLIGVALGWAVVQLVGPGLSADGVRPLVGGVIGIMAFAGIGAGIGALLRNTVAAVAVPVCWLFVLESMILMASSAYEMFRPVAEILPGVRVGELSGSGTGMVTEYSPVVDALIVIAWLVVICGLGLWRNRRADTK